MTKTRLMMRAATELSKDERRWHTSSPTKLEDASQRRQKIYVLGFSINNLPHTHPWDERYIYLHEWLDF